MKKIIMILSGVIAWAGMAVANPLLPPTLEQRAKSANCLSTKSEAAHVTQGLRNGIMPVEQIGTRADSYTVIKDDDIKGGTRTELTVMGNATFEYYDNIYVAVFQDRATNMIEMEDGTVYVKNVISMLPTDSYIKGQREGDKITFTFPQLVFDDFELSNGMQVYYMYFVHRMKQKYDDSGDMWYFVDDANDEIVFEKEGDEWIMDYSDGEFILGLTDDKGNWTGFGDWGTIMAPFTDVPLQGRDGSEYERWALSQGLDGRWVTIDRDDDIFMIKGFFKEMPEAWIKSDVKDDKVVFPGKQYMGVYNNFHVYFMPAEKKTGTGIGGEATEYYAFLDECEFTYDRENDVLQNTGSIILNSGTEYEGVNEVCENTKIKSQKSLTNFTPLAPVCVRLTAWDHNYNWALFFFDIPVLNVEGDLLDPENLYYSIWRDGEEYVLPGGEFSHHEKPYIDLEYYFQDDWDVWVSDVNHCVAIYDNDFDEIGVQSKYKDADGNMHLSEVAYMKNTNGVKAVENDAPVASEAWFDMMGVRVEKPSAGMYIRVVKYADGTSKSFKVLVK